MPTHPPSQPETVEALIEQIRHAARAYRALPAAGDPAGGMDGTELAGAGPIDGYVAELWRRSQPRSELPHRFRRLPLTIAPIGRLALRLYNLLTKEQRAANALMCDALKALQSSFVQRQQASRENAILVDYVRAQLKRGAVARRSSPGYDPGLDEFLVALGDRFRGTPGSITERLRVYLPLLRDAGFKGPALDLGCGRGEWLELMRDANVEAVGVEHNRLLLDVCAGKDLKVVDADLTAFLRQAPAEHWQLVTAFHVIEHLGWPGWLAFLRDIYRVLRPGGMAIVETPSPGNLVTAANRFHLDPTHRHPLPDALLEFASTQVGFDRVEIMPLRAEAEAVTRLVAAGVPAELVDRLFGSQDYAIIARR